MAATLLAGGVIAGVASAPAMAAAQPSWQVGWKQVAFPGQSNETVVAAAATSASNVWAFTDNGPRSRALRWNGQRWSVQRTFEVPKQNGYRCETGKAVASVPWDGRRPGLRCRRQIAFTGRSRSCRHATPGFTADKSSRCVSGAGRPALYSLPG